MAFQARLRQDGISIDYTPGADVQAGDVVPLASLCGVANHKILSGMLGSVRISGIFDVVKAAGAWTIGDFLYWDATAANATKTAAGNTPLGLAAAAAASGDASGFVRLMPQFYGTAAVLGIGASTAAAGTTTADAGALPAGTAPVYPTTAADDTKGVVVNVADKVTGRTIRIGNGVANKILKVYPAAGGTINGAAADAAFSSVSGKGVTLICLNQAANTWLDF